MTDPSDSQTDSEGPLGSDAEEAALFLDTQGLADSDQSLSDRDQTLADRDQSSSERDQLAADSDQAAADRDFAAQKEAGTEADLPEYHLSRVQRLSGTAIRMKTREDRMVTSVERDSLAATRDLNADARDQIAARLDQVRERTDGRRRERTPEAAQILDRLAAIRNRAVEDRRQAQDDRRRAAGNRRRAAHDRHEAETEYQASTKGRQDGGLDRGVGDLILEDRIAEAREDGAELTLVCVKIDGSPPDGNQPASIATVLTAIQEILPNGSPVLKDGDDGLIFAATGEDGLRQIEEIAAALGRRVAIGRAEMRHGDTLSTLRESAFRDRDAQAGADGTS